MPLINILGIIIQQFLFIFTELSSQFQIRHPTPPPQPSQPQNSPQIHQRQVTILPQGLRLRSRDGTFYDLVPPVNPVNTDDNFTIGILDPNGFLRPFFYQGRMVKIRRHGPGHFEIIPVTFQEYRHFRYNQDITPYHDAAAREAK